MTNGPRGAVDLAELQKQRMREALSVCPKGCEPGLNLWSIPDEGNGVGRCLQCLTYYEVDRGGKARIVRQAQDMMLGFSDSYPGPVSGEEQQQEEGG